MAVSRSSLTYAERLDDDESLSDMFARRRREGAEFWASEWDEYAKLQRYANQQQWPARRGPANSASANVNTGGNNDSAQRSPRLVFDRTSVIVQTASGKQIIGRFDRGYLPRNTSSQRRAEIMSSLDRAFMQATDDEQVTSAAFKDGPIIQGSSCVRWELDTLNEKGGGIIKRHLPMWQVMVDPNAREINFSDRAWHRYGEWWPQSEVKARWPDKYDEIVSSIGATSWAPEEVSESSRVPWAGMAGNRPFTGQYYPNGQTLWIEFEEWREVTTTYVASVPADEMSSYNDAMTAAAQRGDSDPDPFVEREFSTWAEVRAWKDERQATFGEDVPKEFIAPRRQLVYKYAYLCGDTTLETDDSKTNYWTIQFMTGFRFPQPTKTVFRSLLSRLVDPQKFINVMMSMLLRSLQISPKGLLFIEEGWFGASSDEARDMWSAPGGILTLKRGALTGGGPPGYKWESGGSSPYTGIVESLLTFYKDALPEIAGFNPGALGQLGGDLRRISGEVIRQVTDAAMTSNAEPFDSVRLYSREGGRILLSFLRAGFFTIDQLVRIVGEDVAYETVTEPVQPQPVLDARGQPVIAANGQPTTRPAIDPQTGEQLMRAAIDPTTGEPQRRLMIDETMFDESFWKEISVEDITPVADQQTAFWKAMETALPVLMQPQPDTGMPAFTSEDIIEMAPGIPPYIRARMLQRVKLRKTFAWQQSQQAQQVQAQQGQQGEQTSSSGGGSQQAA